MSTPRFYCPAKLATGAIISLPENDATHAAKALRMQSGDKLVVFNGDGNDYHAEILRISKQDVTAKILEAWEVDRESPLSITLVQAISGGERMEFTLQKAVEMGVNRIQPVAAERSVVKLSGERSDKRREHWQNVVIAACKQSGRAVIPEVAPIQGFTEWLGMPSDFALKLMLSPEGEQTLHDLPKPQGNICLLIGCEGGFSSTEQQNAVLCGFVPARLGKRILRTETAALAAIAALQTLWGDYNLR